MDPVNGPQREQSEEKTEKPGPGDLEAAASSHPDVNPGETGGKGHGEGEVFSVPDRSLQVQIAGGILIALGLMAGFALLLVLLAASMGPAMQQAFPPGQKADFHSAAYFYLLVTMFFFWMGTGALMLKRWVRPLILSLMWPALIGGTLSFLVMALMIPSIKELAASADHAGGGKMMDFALGCSFGLLFMLYMIVPALFLFLFQGDDVRHTLEMKDVSPSWTDACPVPVFALALWLFLMAFLRLLSSATPSMILFGALIKGQPFLLITAALFATKLLLSWGVYRLKKPAWWGVLVFYLLFVASTSVTFIRGDFAKLATAAGSLPAGQVEILNRIMAQYGPLFAALTFLCLAGTFGFIIYIRRFFEGEGISSEHE